MKKHSTNEDSSMKLFPGSTLRTSHLGLHDTMRLLKGSLFLLSESNCHDTVTMNDFLKTKNVGPQFKLGHQPY